VIAHYDCQTEEEGAAEIETAPETPGETWMSVPTELVGAINRLIKDHADKASPMRSRNHPKKGTHEKNAKIASEKKTTPWHQTAREDVSARASWPLTSNAVKDFNRQHSRFRPPLPPVLRLSGFASASNGKRK